MSPLLPTIFKGNIMTGLIAIPIMVLSLFLFSKAEDCGNKMEKEFKKTYGQIEENSVDLWIEFQKNNIDEICHDIRKN